MKWLASTNCQEKGVEIVLNQNYFLSKLDENLISRLREIGYSIDKHSEDKY